METLSQPITRKIPEMKDLFAVAPHALTYKISKRMEKLSFRRKLSEVFLRMPGAVSPAALKAIGKYYYICWVLRDL